jgi:transaldolase
MTRLQDLYDIGGQSPWLDNLRRDWLNSGQLADLIALGVRGITSNPTIFANAISGQDTYDDQFRELMKDHTVESAYWELAITDITNALALLRPLYDGSDGEDGFVSLEVSPALAHDTEGTVRDARMLHERIAQPNLLVKVPATKEGVPAIHTMISEGRSINVTLIFGIDRYDEVVEAYISGLEALVAAGREDELPKVASVASFFVSRVDTEVDRRLEQLAGGDGNSSGSAGSGGSSGSAGLSGQGDPAILALRGKAAVAQAQVAYQHFHAAFTSDRWKALDAKGARVQRPLWASTSTKNPAYDDLLYVNTLIAPSTVNTMPDGTLKAFEDHGTLHRTADADPQGADDVLAALADAGVDMDDVEQVLEDEGVHSFAKSFDELLQKLTDKAATF